MLKTIETYIGPRMTGSLRCWIGMLTMAVAIFDAPTAARADIITPQVIYDESISGDLTFGFNDVVTQFSLTPGSSEIIGVVGPAATDTWDPFSFIIQPGQRLDALILLSLTRGNTAITLFNGPIPDVPNDIGGVVAQPADVGLNLLPLMGLPSTLPAGIYSARLFAPDDFPRSYQLEFEVSAVPTVPEPTPFYLLLLPLLVIFCHNWLRKRNAG